MKKNKIITIVPISLSAICSPALLASVSCGTQSNIVKNINTIKTEKIVNDVEEVVWENSEDPAPEADWSSIHYQFGNDDETQTGSQLALIPSNQWERMKTESFYLVLSYSDDNFQIRLTNGTWTVPDGQIPDFKKGDDRLTKNPDGTLTARIDIADTVLVDPNAWDNMDNVDILFSGQNYTPLRIFLTNPEPTTYTVSFNMMGHGSQISPITDVESGSTITEPTAPSQFGFDFTGWFKDESLENQWVFATDTVTDNITLYAGWEDKVDSIKVETQPTKLEYNVGEDLDLSGLTIQVQSGETQQTIPVTMDMISGFDKTKVGEQTITITYGDQTTTFKITVLEKETKGLSKAAIAGIVVGSIAGLGLIALIIVLCLKKKKSKKNK